MGRRQRLAGRAQEEGIGVGISTIHSLAGKFRCMPPITDLRDNRMIQRSITTSSPHSSHPMVVMKILPTLLLSAAGSLPRSWAFLVPVVRPTSCNKPSQLMAQQKDDDDDGGCNRQLLRRKFLLQTLGVASLVSTSSIVSFPSITYADNDDENYLYKSGDKDRADLTSQLFNPDGSLRDPNMAVEAQEKPVNFPFSIPTSSDGVNINIYTDGRTTSGATDVETNLKASYKLPLKWNQDSTSQLPLYYDSSEGKNGKSCNRITVYSISGPNNLDMSTLEKASKVGVAKSLFMDQIPNKYFDEGVSKSDLISGRTVRKPIKSADVEGGIDEQTYYEFDLAFAPVSCPDFTEGNTENLGLGFCPYDSIFLVSATVLNNEKDKSGTLMCCVVECDKDEWKLGNSDLKRVRSSFVVDRA